MNKHLPDGIGRKNRDKQLVRACLSDAHSGTQAMNTGTFDIPSTDYWFKVIEMLQQNWALVTPNDDGSATAHFFGDTSGVFDRLSFPSQSDAETALTRNGFHRYADDTHAQSFIRQPSPPFREQPHPNGRIYSSGRFWK